MKPMRMTKGDENLPFLGITSLVLVSLNKRCFVIHKDRQIETLKSDIE